MSSLLRTEAIDRAELIKVAHTRVELDLRGAAPEQGDTFTSRTTLTFECAVEGASTFCDFAGASLVHATLNGDELPAGALTDRRLALTGLHAGSNELVVEGVMTYSTDGEGLHRHTDPADGHTYLYAMSFLDAAPRWFACFDQPDLKSPYEFSVVAPDDWVVRGNGPAGSEGSGRWEIVQAAPLSTYFVTLVAGPYAHHEIEHDGIRLGVLARHSLADELAAQAEDLFTVTRHCFDAFHALFGVRYPFGEYHQAFVPDFNAGAMENPGCVTFRDQYIFRGAATQFERGGRASTIAHEMAHQWFGDLVTMQWWDDLWLNESFAEYMGHRVCTEATDYPVWTEFGISRKDWGAVVDQSSSTHPVAGNGAADASSALAQFDGISYAKGASVLRQLATHLGDDIFLAGLRDHFESHAYGNATFADLMQSWQRAGHAAGADLDLDGWAAQWLLTSGMDQLAVTGEKPKELRRVPPVDDPEAQRPHTLTVASLAADGSELGRVAVRVAGASTELDLPDGFLVPDAGDQTWARITPSDWSAAPPLGTIADPATRVVLHNALRDGVRNADLSPNTALQTILTAVESEPDDQLLRSVLVFASEHLAGPYCRPADRAARRSMISSVVDRLLAEAEPGSDRQLVAFRLAAAGCDDADRLRRWLAGTEVPTGLELDHELMWAVTVRLVSLTGEEAAIEQALAKDPSTSAAMHAARARASIPTAQAKDRAFALLMQPSTASAYEIYATAAGFFRPEQYEVTEPYVARYFADIDRTRDFRTGWALGRVALDAFPMNWPDRRTLELAEQTLATELHPAVRRSVSDGTDQLRRAVRSLDAFTEE
ncbi:aminopeptidase N [Propionibacteriaceae bacterium Y1685]